jgi:hypothetical protein
MTADGVSGRRGSPSRHRVPHRKAPAESAEHAGFGPGISLEGDYLALRWTKEQAAEALDSAGMTLTQILATHLAPRLDATRTVNIKYRGVTTDTYRDPE